MHVAVTAVGADRPGIAAAVATVLYEHGGNIEDSRMAILGGHFAMMLIVALPEAGDAAGLEAALAGPARTFDLIVAVRPVAEVSPEHAEGSPYIVTVYGADKPGIVARACETLAAHRVNITDLATRMVGGDDPVYVMFLEATLPAGADAAVVEADLKALAAELSVDVAFHPVEAETGIAAPQIGVAARAFCLDVSAHKRAKTNHGLVVMINPLVVASDGREVMREGCMSLPDLTANVGRAFALTVEGATPTGEPVRMDAEGFEARAFQHEIDHLSGLLFLDRVSSLLADVFPRKRYER
jgi:peptide deformylase